MYKNRGLGKGKKSKTRQFIGSFTDGWLIRPEKKKRGKKALMRSDALVESNKLVTNTEKDDLREPRLGKVPLVLNNAERVSMKKC